MRIECIVNGPIQTNTYVVVNGNECIVIDPAFDYDKISTKTKGKEVRAVLLTHGHFDHIGAVSEYNDREIDVYIHRADLDKLDKQKATASLFGVKFHGQARANKLLNGNELLELAGLRVRVMHTPGHSSGSVCYIIDNNIFSGDTLFYNSYGRVDFEDGDFYSIKDSIINKLFELNGEYNVYPGHDISTTLDNERRYNAILL